MNTSDITNRFIEFYEYCINNKLVRSTAQFAKNIGMTRGGLAEILKGKNDVGLKTVMNTLQHYKTLNRYWLVFGEQEMLKTTPIEQNSLKEKNDLNSSVIIELLTSEIDRLRKEDRKSVVQGKSLVRE